jgi:hypothetical protein
MLKIRLEELRNYGESGFVQLRSTYNLTQWWPSVEIVKSGFQEGKNITTIFDSAMDNLGQAYGNEPWWSTAEDLVWVLIQV